MAMQFSGKRIQIDRAKAMVVGSVGVAVFLLTFALFAGNALLSQRSYQAKVIGDQEKARDNLKDNIKSVNQLLGSYEQFVDQPTNVLGGTANGTGDSDGDNARIVLDALPSKYDFPALQSSIEKLLTKGNFKIESITGIDDEVAQSGNATSSTAVEIPFGFTADNSYQNIQVLIDILQRSIRPISIQMITLSGKDNMMKLELTAKTYYLPEKQLNFPTKVVQ